MAEITVNDLLSQEVKRDPAAFYAQLREQEPLSYLADFSGLGGAWVVTHYDDVVEILKDPRFIKDPQKVAILQGKPENRPPDDPFSWRRDMLTVDPPDHTRLRNLASKAFTPRMIELLRPRIQQIADELLTAVQDKGQMDLINDFAFPLPITVISELLGIPVADRQQFRTWTRTLLTSTDRRMQGGEYQEAIVAAQNKFSQYIKALIAEKRAHPGNDLVSSMVKTDENGDTLTEKELISTIFLLIVAGHETTVNLIGNGTLALLQHPDQLHLLQQDPSLVISAIEELLRYTAPVSLSSPRWASEDITIHGKVIKKGEMVFVALAGANTDPGQFEHPNQLNITREEQKHLAFGKGIHFCLGAPLARLEGQIAFNTLLQRFPQLHLDCDPDQLNWVRTPILRGLTSLPVAF